MRGLVAIYRKEMGHYFVSPIAYMVAGVFLVLTGFFFYQFVAIFMERALEAGMQSMRMGRAPEIDVPGLVIRNFFGLLGTVILFVAPMLTMGNYTEEKKRGTMELLMTSPLRELDIVLGKFLATLSLFAIMLLPTALYQAVLFLSSEPRPPWRLILAGYLGVLLLGGVLIALGGFLSSLTENQIVASMLTFGLFLILWVIDISARGSSSAMGEVIQYISILRHYDDFTRGVIDTSSLLFYASLIVLGLFLTHRSVDALRWRRA
ncbi:MAG: ABC transporter permease subunit [Acidobacteria bacterium]|nr:ABC transporter permease subunit [Acidobacteriota bacterium]